MAASKTKTPSLHKLSFEDPKLEGLRGISLLLRSDAMYVVIQTLEEGGRQGLHAHAALDGLYYVLSGRGRFYGEGNTLMAEVGPNEGVYVPRGTVYGFEAVGGRLQMLSVEAIDKSIEDRFISHAPESDTPNYGTYSATGERLENGTFAVDTVEG